MKKLLLTGLILSVLIFGLLIGCSDDDECSTCPENTQEGVAVFYAGVHNGDLDCYGVVYGIDARFIDLDSALIGTHLLEQDQYFGEGMATYCGLSEESNISASSGQTYTIKLYTPGGTSQGSVMLLEDDVDMPEVVDWRLNYPYDTVEISTDVDITWGTVAKADFYTVDWSFEYYDGNYHRIDSTFITNDTTFTIPGNLLDRNGYIYLDIYSIKGPEFDAVGNFTGKIKGRIISAAGEYFQIVVGFSDPSVVGMEIPDHEEQNHKDFKDLLLKLSK